MFDSHLQFLAVILSFAGRWRVVGEYDDVGNVDVVKTVLAYSGVITMLKLFYVGVSSTWRDDTMNYFGSSLSDKAYKSYLMYFRVIFFFHLISNIRRLIITYICNGFSEFSFSFSP